MEESTFLNPGAAVAALGVGESARVADFGASAGFFARAAARVAGPGGVVWAVDISSDTLSRLKATALAEGLHNVEVLRGDTSRINGTALPEASFDFVLVVNTLFSLEDKSGLVAEARRVLAPRGQALVVDWRGSFGGLGPAEEHLITAGQARDIFEASGFAYGHDIPAGEYHWGFVARKK